MATILIADGDPIFRKGLRSFLEGIAGVSVQAEAADAEEVLSIVSKNRGINLVISESGGPIQFPLSINSCSFLRS